MADELGVWLHGVPVAHLSRRRSGDLAITYDSKLVAARGAGALCLSVALPLAEKPYIGQAAKRWLEGLLPEGETRTALEEAFAVERGDTFALLAAIGRDCAGAVSFLPPGEQPAGGDLEAITDDQLADLLDSLPEHPLGAERMLRERVEEVSQLVVGDRLEVAAGRLLAGRQERDGAGAVAADRGEKRERVATLDCERLLECGAGLAFREEPFEPPLRRLPDVGLLGERERDRQAKGAGAAGGDQLGVVGDGEVAGAAAGQMGDRDAVQPDAELVSHRPNEKLRRR